MGKLTRVIQGLLIANAVLFVATEFIPGLKERIFEALALWFPRNEHFGAWQVVTSVFLHGGVSHIFFNMFALLSFGLPLEQRWGARRFLIFYLCCGIGASIIHTGVQWLEFQNLFQRLVESGVPSHDITAMLVAETLGPSLSTPELRSSFLDLYRVYAAPTVGASGAIYGILVAFGLSYPNAKLSLLFLPFPIPAKYFIPIMVGLDLFSGVTGFSIFGGGIAHFAHVGGALIGFLFMMAWRRATPAYPREEAV